MLTFLNTLNWKLVGMWLLTLLSIVLSVFGLYRIWSNFGSMGLLVDSIIVGGIGGGFTLALSGGESYGLKIPGTANSNGVKIDPGFLGDVVVGLMAGFLGIGFGIGAGVKLFMGAFDTNHQPFAELVVKNFAIAYACGYLGLRLVKSISSNFIRQVEIEEKLEKVKTNETDNLYLKANELIREGQFEEALHMFNKVHTIEGEKSIRGAIGLGRAFRRLGKYGDAIAILDRAIEREASDPNRNRVPVAYWNRACYLALGSRNLKVDLEKIVNDLKRAIKLQPSFQCDLLVEEDLKSLHEEEKFKALVADKVV